ncbi:HD domain-containing protein [Paenibacillus pinistramenti]|uniref:HD domain-containing protein n=1 Tax=Paenibacillus pinistramenti TaxID=1768003 RepID=UPI001107DACF|nr:HD domain-containing protein [Paenibacillus pinistramenti]
MILEQAERFVQDTLGSDRSGHDWWHIYRVRRMALELAALEGADLFVCELAALLHDVADEKLNASKEAGLEKVSSWLKRHLDDPQDEPVILHVMSIISTMSYNGGKNPPVTTLEGKVVQDADRLDAIGAVGIARTFAYGGSKGRSIHEPGRDFSENGYRSEENTTVHHFYDKLLRLKDLMNTEHARRLAENRHRFMEQFLDQFYKEWEALDGRDA